MLGSRAPLASCKQGGGGSSRSSPLNVFHSLLPPNKIGWQDEGPLGRRGFACRRFRSW